MTRKRLNGRRVEGIGYRVCRIHMVHFPWLHFSGGNCNVTMKISQSFLRREPLGGAKPIVLPFGGSAIACRRLGAAC